MTEIEIPDPSAAPADPEEQAEAPYRNLLVPLVVVPALIVMVIVLVFTLFGAIAGDEATPRENLDRVLHGGANERQQAAFNLVGQVLRDWEGEEDASGAFDASLLPDLRRAWDQNAVFERSADVPIPLALAILMAQLGDLEGLRHLTGLTELGDTVDPEGKYRFYAAVALGTLGERLDESGREEAAGALIRLLDAPDDGLRSAAAIALQTLPTERTNVALEGLLSAASPELRMNAALSLARLGSRAGVGVLQEMLAAETYAQERARDKTKWVRERDVSESRQLALRALVSLDATPERHELEALAKSEPDLAVREIAQSLLAGE